MSRMLERFWLTNQEDRKFECRVSDHKTERPAKLHRVMVDAFLFGGCTRPAEAASDGIRCTGKPRGMMGRPPTGLRRGERLTDYKRITVRLPPRTVSRLEALAGQLQIT
jgi:hypothetical protein